MAAGGRVLLDDSHSPLVLLLCRGVGMKLQKIGGSMKRRPLLKAGFETTHLMQNGVPFSPYLISEANASAPSAVCGQLFTYCTSNRLQSGVILEIRFFTHSCKGRPELACSEYVHAVAQFSRVG